MRIALVLVAFLVASCVTQDYVGRTYSPTEHVDVYFSESEITRPFETMGREHAEAPELLTSDQIVQKIVTEAKKHGADAILIENMETIAVGSTTSTFGTKPSTTKYYATTDGKLHTYHEPSGKYRETSHTISQRNKVVTARFLKYTKQD